MNGVPFERHLLSLMLVLPLFGLLALAAARFLRKDRGTSQLWKVAAVVGAGQLAVALAVHARFDVAAIRHKGTQGFQFVERAVLLRGAGIEYALGVDGLSVGIVVFAAFALFAVVVLGRGAKTDVARHWALVLLADLGAIGALIAIDLALVLAFWGLALLALVLMVHSSAMTATRSTTVRFAVACSAAYLLVAAACLLIASHAGPVTLIDGTGAAWAFSIPGILHADVVAPGQVIAQIPVIKWIYAALFVGLGTLMGLAPLHAWLAGTTARVPGATALSVSIVAGSVASYLFLRLGYTVLPAGTAWAAPFLSGMGALSVVWGAFAGAARNDLRRIAGSVTAVTAGITLFAIGSLTAIGLEGAVAAMHNHILYSVLVFGIVVEIEARSANAELRRVRALSSGAPLVALIVAIAGSSQLGAPGSYAFVARLLALVGAVPLRPIAAVAVVVGLLVVAITHARYVQRVLASRKQDSSEAAGRASASNIGPAGKAVLALAALAVVVLGFWPKPALSPVSTSALEHAARVNPPGPLEIVERPANRPRHALARALPTFRPVQAQLDRLSESHDRPLLAACVQVRP